MKEQRRGNFVESSLSYQDFYGDGKMGNRVQWERCELSSWESQENMEGPHRKGFWDVLDMELYV